MAELGPEPNPDDPRLPEMVLEPKLSEIRDSLAQAVAKNQVYEIGNETSYEILTTTLDATGVTATLIVCTVAADRVIDRDTGDVVSDGASTLKEEITYRRQNGRWMIEKYQNLDSWEGITTCE